ncbi:CU044_2847 family protein [Streptomyces sp. NPDC051940]|uniref:CU044_2847 family protein n=1 Tax=Streptomyces sp. NPDC051940 TaxID=3155675 RepID=UPI003413C60A
MESVPERVVLPDGTEIWARVGVLPPQPGEEPEEDPTGAGDLEDVSVWDTLRRRVRGLDGIVSGVAASVRAATEAVAPDEVSVTFGVEMAVKAGGAVALLADGQLGTNLSITLTWNGSGGSAAPSGETGRPAPGDGSPPTGEAGRPAAPGGQ